MIIFDFWDIKRIYKISGLLGFYGSLIKDISGWECFGLDSIFVNSIKGLDGEEEIF